MTGVWEDGDFTGDIFVDIDDLHVLAASWLDPVTLQDAIASAGLPAIPLPEPLALPIGAVCAALLLKRPKRQ
jgi:hypothetical protein